MDIFDLVPDTDTIIVDLTELKSTLKNEDGTPMTIEVYLPHTKEYRKAKHKQTNTIIKANKTEFESEEMEELGFNLLASIIKDWNITVKGQKPKFTVKKAVEVFDVVVAIPNLIQKKLDEQENFTQ